MKNAALLAVAISVLAAVPARADTPNPDVLRAINTERTGNGLGAVVEQPDWSNACAAHDRWMVLNDKIQHPEDPGSPGYTDIGNWAGTHAILAKQPGGWRNGNPFESAPLHQSQLMDPLLATVGVDDVHDAQCVTTWIGNAARSAPSSTLQWFPAPNATLPYAMTVREDPISPGEFVGLPEGTTTGPYLYLYAPGLNGDPNLDDNYCKPDAAGTACEPGTQTSATPWDVAYNHPFNATLVGPAGPVDVRTIDEPLEASKGYPRLMAAIGMFVPAQPLAPNSTYTLTADVDAQPPANAATLNAVYRTPAPTRVSLTFHTAAAPPPQPTRPTVSVPRTARHGTSISVLLKTPRIVNANIAARRGNRLIKVSKFRNLTGTRRLTIGVPKRYRTRGSRVRLNIHMVDSSGKLTVVYGTVRYT